MKKIYLPLLLPLTFFLATCSKDILKSYDKRIKGTWRLTDVDRYGFGSSGTPFRSGLFTFTEDGELTYINDAGDTATGSWDVQRRWSQGNCYTDDNGNNNCNDRYIHSLSVSVVNFTTQEFRSEYFDEITFTGTNRFNAIVHLGAGAYVFRFRRQ